jgi:hypothetical protein
MHMLHPDLLRRAVRVLVIGCGGSGASIASGLPPSMTRTMIANSPSPSTFAKASASAKASADRSADRSIPLPALCL